jgi:hypothetical protein
MLHCVNIGDATLCCPAVVQHITIKFEAILSEPSQIDSTNLIIEERVFAAVASLGDVVRHATEYGLSLSWHG